MVQIEKLTERGRCWRTRRRVLRRRRSSGRGGRLTEGSSKVGPLTLRKRTIARRLRRRRRRAIEARGLERFPQALIRIGLALLRTIRTAEQALARQGHVEGRTIADAVVTEGDSSAEQSSTVQENCRRPVGQAHFCIRSSKCCPGCSLLFDSSASLKLDF